MKFSLTRILSLALFSLGLVMRTDSSAASEKKNATSLYSLTVTSISGEPVSLAQYEGYVLLIVNTASKCGFTSQYRDLEEIYSKYKDRKFAVLGFPSNDFMSQEPGTDEEVKAFCTSKFGVDFPLFSKAPVTGELKQPVYTYLTEQSGDEFEGEIKWNFEKFLIDRSGQVRARYGSITNPSSNRLVGQLEKLLSE